MSFEKEFMGVTCSYKSPDKPPAQPGKVKMTLSVTAKPIWISAGFFVVMTTMLLGTGVIISTAVSKLSGS